MLCSFVVEAAFPAEAQRNAGAPSGVYLSLDVVGSASTTRTLSLDWTVYLINKRPTRLPESIFLSFVPPLDADSWRLQVLNSSMIPTDTLGHRASSDKDTVYGGSPHLRGVEAAYWTGEAGSASFTSLDVPILSTGLASPFPTPRTSPPNMSQGIHWNIFNNIWNTNYVLWYPFVDKDANISTRFNVKLNFDQNYSEAELSSFLTV